MSSALNEQKLQDCFAKKPETSRGRQPYRLFVRDDAPQRQNVTISCFTENRRREHRYLSAKVDKAVQSIMKQNQTELT